MTKSWTQREVMHMDGGGAFWKGEVPFSQTIFEIRADGSDTGITRHIRTDGAQRTVDEFRDGDATFDARTAPSAAIFSWLEERLALVNSTVNSDSPDGPEPPKAA